MKKTVIILTVPRSGSSLLAGILHRLGVSMGQSSDLTLGKHLNKYGCYEDQWFQSISLNILFEAHILLDITRRLDMDEDRMKAVVEKYRSELLRFFNHRHPNIWGFKDPGLIYHLPYYHSYLENPYHIHLIRNTLDTAESWYKTFRSAYWWPELKEKFPLFTPKNRVLTILRSIFLFFSRQKDYTQRGSFEQVIEHGHDRIMNFIGDKKHMTVYLNDLLQSPAEQISKIENFIQLDHDELKFADALDFIDPKILNTSSTIP